MDGLIAELRPGLFHSETMIVREMHTVPSVGAGWPGFEDMPSVYATAMMVGFIEQTCIQALRPFLAPSHRTVGTAISVSHVAATALGMTVRADVRLVEVADRSLVFDVECQDDDGLVGQGKHHRALVQLERFLQRLAERSQE